MSGRALLVGAAALVLCAGGVVLAASVGATPAGGGPVIGQPVVVRPSPSPSPATPSPSATGGTPGPGNHEHQPEGPQVVGPAPVHDVDQEESGAAGSRTHG